MATPVSSTPTHDEHADADVQRIENEIAVARDELGRTVAELGTRLAPAQLLAHAKETIKDATFGRTRAVAQSAGDMASDLAERTRDVAADATRHVRANPAGAAGTGAGLAFGIWAARRVARYVQRDPIDGRYRRVNASPTQLASAAAAVAMAWWVWRGGRL
jgi:hypothetical protein